MSSGAITSPTLRPFAESVSRLLGFTTESALFPGWLPRAIFGKLFY